MGQLSDLRHKAQGEILEILTKVPYDEDVAVPLTKAKHNLSGKSGVSTLWIIKVLTKVHAAVEKTGTLLASDEKWDELALTHSERIEAEIEAHHTQLDKLNEELANIDKWAAKTRAEVAAHFEELAATVSQAVAVASARGGLTAVPSDDEDLA